MAGLKLGSLFDGSGGFPLAGAINGIEPVWSSEIEPYPLRVTAARFPQVKQLGDVTKINGDEIEQVDIITFGSPCQDLSIAGKQAGIHDGERSNLFFEAIRIIKEMRHRDELDGRTGLDIRPRFAVWENVPGAFSSNKGEDFRAVLEAFAGVCEDGLYIPQPKKWDHAGCMVGHGWSVAWRVYDAQYWGVPQRRKRIYLIADFGTERAGEILFERESVSGHPETGREAGQGTADDAEGSSGRGCIAFKERARKPGGGKGILPAVDRAFTLATNVGQSVCIGIDQQGGKGNSAFAENVSPTLCSDSHGTPHGVCYSIQGNAASRDTAQNGAGLSENVAHTLNTQDRHAVCYPDKAMTLTARHDSSPCVDRGQNVVCYDARGNGDGTTAPTITGDHENRVTDYTAVAVGNGQMHQTDLGDKTGALNCMHDQQAVIHDAPPPRKYIIRRLTPLECCRLQGFPDWWTDGVDGSDSAQYKMWGNGIALPCAVDVLRRIAEAVE